MLDCVVIQYGVCSFDTIARCSGTHGRVLGDEHSYAGSLLTLICLNLSLWSKFEFRYYMHIIFSIFIIVTPYIPLHILLTLLYPWKQKYEWYK